MPGIAAESALLAGFSPLMHPTSKNALKTTHRMPGD
jgi:hypothetical protein